MKKSDLIHLRTGAQRILAPFETPDEVVAYFGAMQAQNRAQMLYAIASRTKNSSRAEIERALAENQIIRGWAFRGTIHAMRPEDYFLLKEVYGARTLQIFRGYWKKLGISESDFERSNAELKKQLSDGPKTRAELSASIEQLELPCSGIPFAQLIARANLDDILVFHAEANTFQNTEFLEQHKTDATFDEALQELGRIYFKSRGPATIQDFNWWSGLPQTTIKKMLASLSGELVQDGDFYFYPETKKTATNHTVLLAGFDEWLISYRDRSVHLPEELQREVITKNGLFRPIVVQNGVVKGTWKVEKNSIVHTSGLKIPATNYDKFSEKTE
ncbi:MULTISPECIES: winged helix DNA-binding domain-containing protein [unclassified Listeria]|uniref:winged helix DNA-binding domain-containing protein n=1 Tax=unclassified Listeria TaxID=2642072 RepID=UPI000B58E256|nr:MULTISPECIES: winged helix DNA-binding domain-containing protein [unclassified Listeria]